MSKIEKYNKALATYNQVKRNLMRATGKNDDGTWDDQNDKARISLSFQKLDTNDWGDAILKLHAGYGYYGSSSGYSAMDIETAGYITEALDGLLMQAATLAISLAERDMLKVKEEAKQEALDVLKEIE